MDNQEANDQNLPAERPKGEHDGKVLVKYGSIGLSGGAGVALAYLLLQHADFRAWDTFFRHVLEELMQKEGPAPVLSFLMTGALIISICSVYNRALRDKDREIDRICEEKKELQKILGTTYSSSRQVQSGGQSAKKK